MRSSFGVLLLLSTGCASVHATSSGPSAPFTFVRSTAEAQVTRMIDVRDGLTHAQAFKVVTDALGARFTVDVTDPRVGFAMTAWQATLIRDGVPDPRYRTRITARFQGDDWKRLQLRDEANWARGEEWDVGFDSAQLDSITTDLRAKIGRRP
jgi:hypothetical protein